MKNREKEQKEPKKVQKKELKVVRRVTNLNSKVYNPFSPPPTVCVEKPNYGKIIPDQSMKVKDIIKHFTSSGNTGTAVQGTPQYHPDQDAMDITRNPDAHNAMDYSKVSKSDKIELEDIRRDLKSSLDKHRRAVEKSIAAARDVSNQLKIEKSVRAKIAAEQQSQAPTAPKA